MEGGNSGACSLPWQNARFFICDASNSLRGSIERTSFLCATSHIELFTVIAAFSKEEDEGKEAKIPSDSPH